MQTTSTSTIQQSRAIISRPWVHYIVYIYTVSQKNRAHNIGLHNSRKCGPVLIILSLSHSQMKCR